jgi:photosystem II stability/assembly factor-like uncharacterized protein
MLRSCRLAALVVLAGTVLAGATVALSPSTTLAASHKGSHSSATELSLESFDFSNLSDGFGVFTTVSPSDTCADFVGKSTDGGAKFDSLVRVMSWNCSNSNFTSSVASDDEGDVFLYGPQLFVSHNNGETWSKAPYSGVADVDAVGRSVWLVRSLCTSKEIADDTSCRTGLVESIDGGRTWESMLSPSSGDAGSPIPETMQTYLVRRNRETAYLMLAPGGHPDGSSNIAPLWFTANGGKSWSSRKVPCHIDARSSALSVAPNGTLMTVCASEPGAGSQPKTALESTNAGRTWKLETSGIPYSDLDAGYLGSIDLLSNSRAFLVGDRSSLLETNNGGRIWKAVEPLLGSTAGGTGEIKFFNASDGLVLGNDDNDNERLVLWTTHDGGAHWKVTVPNTTP